MRGLSLYLLAAVLSWPLAADANISPYRNAVLVRVVEKPDGHYFFALNRLPARAELTFRFSRQENVQIPGEMQRVIRLPPREEKFVGKLTARGPGAWRYDYGFAYTGNEVRLSSPSYLPQAVDLASPVAGRYRVSQGFNGEFSHNRPANRYALDIALPIGTPLYATRDGLVAAAVDSHAGGGLRPEFRGKSNYLRLRHDDGTMTLYAHLHTGSLRVKKGDWVRAGQQVAASGNTGYSSGPHLHLAVQRYHNGRVESIPFTLQGRYPKAGSWLLAQGTE
ncbi:M23 family metallopeptidase [Zobellella sp. An-6]|uniref:M23 family metallopeptidase n=1 Tax=Zobellella sp. An-6 TaxID=3400218 RepID=UPI004041FAC5